jgi:hypothetical protein
VPAQGPGQVKLRRKFADPSWLDGLAKSLYAQCVDIERTTRFRFFTISISLDLLEKYFSRCVARDRTSRKIVDLLPRIFSMLRGIFLKNTPIQPDQKALNLPYNGRYTALMTADLSYSNRLGREFQ